MKNFAVIGVGGYIAPRHLKAIKDTGNNCIVALDKNDSVGIIDSYFPESAFFTEFERFDRFVDKLRREDNNQIDYVSICSPNYLHDAHVRFALRIGAHAICEKPLTLNPWNLDALQIISNEYQRNVYTILQLRLHDQIKKLKQKIEQSSHDKIYDVELTYITPRGKWYLASWKGDIDKSGGVATNIGVHFFDMLTWIFGPPINNVVNISQPTKMAGLLSLQKANVKWFLSLDKNDLLYCNNKQEIKSFRSIKIDNEEIEFSDGFTDLHTISYQNILNNNGFTIQDVRLAIDIVSEIRDKQPIGVKGDYNPILNKMF